MADIELVIKIPEELYKDIKEHGLCGYCSDREIVSRAICNGTQLPKGHGKIVDADRVIENYDIWEVEMALRLTEAIIEADKAGKRGN